MHFLIAPNDTFRPLLEQHSRHIFWPISKRRRIERTNEQQMFGKYNSFDLLKKYDRNGGKFQNQCLPNIACRRQVKSSLPLFWHYQRLMRPQPHRYRGRSNHPLRRVCPPFPLSLIFNHLATRFSNSVSTFATSSMISNLSVNQQAGIFSK